MKKLLMLTASAAVLALSGVQARADSTTIWFVPGPVELRAGPDTSFPVVDSIPANAKMQLEGCLAGWTWCDISWQNKRGWVSGDNIVSIYQKKNTYVTQVGSVLKVPVISYSTSTYWDKYYKTAPFYTKRAEFVEWAPSAPAAE